MIVARPNDNLQVINGPEDGTDFPIIRSPFYIGSDPHCEVTLVMDGTVEPLHALLSVVSEGYRVRRISPSPVWVNGKRVGRIFSRILRDGDMLRVGDTVLVLQCSREGLASRSIGAVSESDLGWLVRRTARFLVQGVRSVVSFTAWLIRSLFSSWWFFVGLLIAAYVLSPTFRWYVIGYSRYLLERILSSFNR